MFRRLAVSAAALLLVAPAVAGAQDFKIRTYHMSGCDGTFICLWATGQSFAYTDEFGVRRFSDVTVTVDSARASVGFASAEAAGLVPQDFTVFPFTQPGQDDSGFVTCIFTVCRGAASILASGSGRGAYGSVPSAVIRFAYYAPTVPEGTAIGDPGSPEPVDFGAVGLSVTPEPATVALAGAGVLLLGVWARRRQTA